jgi:hypothetical protein
LKQLPPVDNFIEQLCDLHYGTSRLERKKILPKPLLYFVCQILLDAYHPPFREYIEKSYRAINAFRDGLPSEAFAKHELSLLTRTASFPLPYRQLADFFRDPKYYQPYHLDFSEPKPSFYQSEPSDPDDRRHWRDDLREHKEEVSDWKDRKRVHERRQKELPELSPVQEAFLGTPFPTNLPEHWEYQVPFEIPPHLRFGHQFLVGASRSGKTTFLTAQLLEDLKRVQRGECSVIVMDSQNEFVPNISKLALFGRGQPLEGKLVYLEPAKFSIAANIFDFGNLSTFSADDRKELFRSSFDNIEMFLDSVFEADTSTPQKAMLRNLIQALILIPEATLFTLQELITEDGYRKHTKYFADLDTWVKKWLDTRLFEKNSAITRNAVQNRLDYLFSDPLFREMLNSSKNTLDLFEQLNEPKVILINTAGLGGAMEPFGRYFIAKLEEAILKRKFIQKASKLPVFFYVDEASEYYGKEIRVAKMIDRLGKQGLATIFAVQGVDHFSAPVLAAMQRAAIQAWTIEKPIVNISLNHKEPVQVTVPLIELDKQPRMPETEYESLQADMRRRYGSEPVKEPEPLPRAEANTEKIELPKAKPKIKAPKPDEDETDAKPW